MIRLCEKRAMHAESLTYDLVWHVRATVRREQITIDKIFLSRTYTVLGQKIFALTQNIRRRRTTDTLFADDIKVGSHCR